VQSKGQRESAQAVQAPRAPLNPNTLVQKTQRNSLNNKKSPPGLRESFLKIHLINYFTIK